MSYNTCFCGAEKCGMESYDYFNFLLTVFSQHATAASFFFVVLVAVLCFVFIYFNNRNFKSIITSTTLAVALHKFPFSFVVLLTEQWMNEKAKAKKNRNTMRKIGKCNFRNFLWNEIKTTFLNYPTFTTIYIVCLD